MHKTNKRNYEGSDPRSQLCSALATLFLFSFFFFFFLCTFLCFLVLLEFLSPLTCMTIYRKQPRRVDKFAQASCSSPRRICCLLVKASTHPGELLAYRWSKIFSPGKLVASLGEFQVRNLCEKTILHFLLALFLDLTNNHQNLQNHEWIFHIKTTTFINV